MAKMFYTLDETKAALGRNEEDIKQLSREGRLLYLVVEIEDRPGWLARIAAVVSEAGANILEVSHNRMMMDLSAKSADLGLVVEARDSDHAAEVRKALMDAGFVLRAAASQPAVLCSVTGAAR